jgi:hypothetical protein
VKCPPLAVILQDENVVKAAREMSARTAETGKEYGAYLYLNADGTVRVGEVTPGTSADVPLPDPDGTEIGEIHTHPDLGTGDYVIKNSLPSGDDIARVWAYRHNSLVVGSSQIHAVPWQNPNLIFTVPLP